MTASTAGVPALDSLSVEGQAAALWTYVHLKVPRFTSERALEVIRQLSPAPDEEPKALAKRLRKELQDCGVALKHTHALHAASRLLVACCLSALAAKAPRSRRAKSPQKTPTMVHPLSNGRLSGIFGISPAAKPTTSRRPRQAVERSACSVCGPPTGSSTSVPPAVIRRCSARARPPARGGRAQPRSAGR